jgi:ABC-type transport system substrate-binding protein
LLRASAVLASAAALVPGSGVGRENAPGSVRRSTLQDDIETGVDLVIPFDPFNQPVNLHPHRAPNWGPFWVLLPHVWAGLLAFDEHGRVVPDLAESVEPNASADVWTATLRPDLAFANGNPITAQSFVNSWRRALDPQLPSPMASFMELVDGYAGYVAGESDDIGFAVIDESTIEITLSEPYSSFPSALATFVWAVVDLDVAGDPALTGASAGLWQFSELVEGERIVMVPSAHAPDPVSPSIASVTWRIFEGGGAATLALEEYRADSLVSVDVPGSMVGTIQNEPDLAGDLRSIESQASTMAIGMDFNQPPFNDLRIRQAVAAAIDRERWAEEIREGEFVAASGLVPPVVSITSGYEPVSPLPFDPDRAASLVADAGVDAGGESSEIVFHQPATDSPEQVGRHAALLDMISENSGLAIRHDTSLTSEQILALQADNGGRQFDIVWWWTVTDTAALVETIGAPESPYMAGWFNWSPTLEGVDNQVPGDAATAFVSAFQAANESVDLEARNAAYRDAEQLLIDNAVYVPLGHWVQRYLQKPWLQGTRQGAWSGRIPVRFDADVVVTGRAGN